MARRPCRNGRVYGVGPRTRLLTPPQAGERQHRRKGNQRRDGCHTCSRRGGRRAPVDVVLHFLERRAHIGRTLITQSRIFFEAALDRAAERGGHTIGQWRRRSVEDGARQFETGCARKRPGPRRHLVQENAERPDIAAFVGRLAAQDFGRHARQRPDDQPCGRDGGGRSGEIFHAVGRKTPRDAKVEHLRPTVRRHHDVGALQVAVCHPVRVRMRQRISDLHSASPHDVDRQPTFRDGLRETPALDILHGNEGLAIVDADFVDRADVRMVQLRRVLGLSTEACMRVAIAVGRQLQCDVAAEIGIASEIHLAHSAGPQQPLDRIPSDGALRLVRHFERRDLDKAAGLVMGSQQALDFHA